MKIGLLFGFCLFTLLVFGQSTSMEFLPKFTKASDGYLSDVMTGVEVESENSFIGLSAYHLGHESSRLMYRIRQSNTWSKWIRFKPQHEGMSPDRTAYEADILRTSFELIQFKTIDKLTSDIHVRIFIPSITNRAPRINARSANCEEPNDCNRDCWCSDCPVDPTPEFTDPTHIIVHHSAGFNQSDDFSSVVAYYWDLHVHTNGWDDIGYNWLIDTNGEVYQGRPDGYQGAHFSCLNENTIGICVIGDYTEEVPSDLALNALVDLIGYEAVDHEIDVLEESYHEIGDITLMNISGHRDGNDSDNGCSTTVCPGDQFYPLLDTIRARVADLPCYKDQITHTENEWSSQIIPFPNPFSSGVSVNSLIFDHNKLSLMNIHGIRVSTSDESGYIDMDTQPSGVYILLYDDRVICKMIKSE